MHFSQETVLECVVNEEWPTRALEERVSDPARALSLGTHT
jgi:hypothetical protein